MPIFKPQQNDTPLTEREQLLAKVRSLLRLEHLRRYGIDDVDEGWLQRQSDESLRRILEAHSASNPKYVY